MELDSSGKWLGSVSHDDCIKLTDVEDLFEDSDNEGMDVDDEKDSDDEDEDDDEADSDSDEDMETEKGGKKKKNKENNMGDFGVNARNETAFFDDL
jgi:hypothetical protein